MLGLSDRVTTNRFGLWALFGASTSLLNAAFMVVQLAGHSPAESAIVHVSSAVFGAISSAAVFLALLPPPRYLARLEADAA